MRGHIGRLAVTAIVALLAALTVAPAAAYHEESRQRDGSHEFADPAFQDRWERTDMPVAEGQVDRTWIWGPEPYTEGMQEEYADSPGGQRLVQYFDKSRMEINDPDAPGDNLWNVTNGLLVVEMVNGWYQVGDAEFDNSPQPAEVPIAGDPDDQFGPTYADINRFNLTDADSRATGTTITETITDDGDVVTDEQYAEYGVTAEYNVQVPGLDHTVAGPFWDFMNSSGLVYEDGEYVTDDLFRNPFYATGYPITEAYWANVEVAGTERDVLWQCFERRCLTYTPGNPEGFVVEAGNVGQHYYRWRYGDQETESAQIQLVAIGDAGESGMLIGCDDSLVPVEVQIPAGLDTGGRVQATLEELFAIDEEFYGESGLYNSLFRSDLSVTNVTVDGDTATVDIEGDLTIGGVCDEPRVVEQIRHTVLGVPGVAQAQITVNGQNLDNLFGPGAPPDETGEVQNWFVLLEDDGENGMLVGCGDSLVPSTVEIEPSDDINVIVERALNALLATDDQNVGDEDELYNALYQSNLTVDSVSVEDGTATVNLSGEYAVGGVCDEPRFVEQIRQTVLQFDQVESAEIMVNGQPLDQLFGGSGELSGGVLATFEVQGEEFNVWSTNPDTIDQILALEAGESQASIPNGPILRGSGTAGFNEPWSWHLDPEQTEMAEATIEVCDGTPSYVENNLDEFVDNIGQYCPWSAELVEVQDLREDG